MITKNINTDIEGIIRELNLSESEVLYPLFEAVVNAIQSIHEKYKDKSKESGEISIFIERDKDEPAVFEEIITHPIKSIQIIDNGIGFNSSNYDSFFKSHTTKKIDIGGKGVGRFTMLSVFNNMTVKSNYQSSNNDGGFTIRRFELSRKDGIKEEEPLKSKSYNNRTEIHLSDINIKFKKISAQYTQENIADNILEHCLLYYLNGEAPKIRVSENNEAIDLDNQFNPNDFIVHRFEDTIIKNKFICYFVKNNKLKAHEYLLCAHNRKVKSKRIDKIFPIFSSKVIDNDEGIWLQAYVVSKYLDDRVNTSRNEIVFPKAKDEIDDNKEGEIEFEQNQRTEVIERDIDNFVINGIQDKYKDTIEQRQEYLRNVVNRYICSDEGLEYRTLDINNNDFLSTIPDTADDKKLDDILHEHQYRNRKNLKKKQEKLLKKRF